jgi:endoglycosylceramidase
MIDGLFRIAKRLAWHEALREATTVTAPERGVSQSEHKIAKRLAWHEALREATTVTAPERGVSQSGLSKLRSTIALALCGAAMLRCGPSVWIVPDSGPTDANADVRGDHYMRSDVYSDGSPDGAPVRVVMPECATPVEPTTLRPVSIRCQHFMDMQQRVLLLHGIGARVEGVFDVSFQDGRVAVESVPAFTEVDARRMRELGYNVLRLPVNWSGVEPSRGTYNEAYINRVAATVDIAQRAGMLTIIDFHQDAYSKEIGEDGAPLWAIRPSPETLLQGPLSAEDLTRRRTSPQVVHAFETFFSPSGEDLRMSYAAMAVHVVRRFVNNEAVLGYELFNEPIAEDSAASALNVSIARAIRAVDTQKLLFFQPPASRNLLDQAMVSSSPFPAAGAVYAPHIYTLAIGGTDAMRRNFTRDTLRASHLNAVREAQAWRTPLFIGEWSYDPSGIRMNEYVEFQQDLQDEFGESAALWVWKERSQNRWGLFDYDAAVDEWTERPAFRRALARVRPEAIAGWPVGWRYDRAARRFELEFTGSATITAPSLIYVPAQEDFATRFATSCDRVVVPVTREPTTGLISVACNGPGRHVIEVTALE